MLNLRHLRNISRSLLPIYASVAINTATPSNSFAQKDSENQPSAEQIIDSVLYFYSDHAIKSPNDYVTSSDPKYEFYSEAVRPGIREYIKKYGRAPPKNPDYSVLKLLGGSKYYRETKQVEKNVGGQTIIKYQGKKGPYDLETKVSRQDISQKQIDLENKVAKKYEAKLDSVFATSGKEKTYAQKMTPQKPVRIVRKPTKLKLIQGQLPAGTSIVTTQDSSDFLKTPIKTNFYRFPSAWGLIEGLELASGRQEISDLLASALPEVRKYKDDLGVSETVMRRFEIDDKKVINGQTLKGADGLPLDNIYPTDNLYWSARVLAKRDYEHITPEVKQKALEQIAKADTVYLRLEQSKQDTVFVKESLPTPAPLPHLKEFEQNKKSDKTAYCILGFGAAGFLGYLLFHKKGNEQPPQQQPSGVYTQEGGNGVE